LSRSVRAKADWRRAPRGCGGRLGHVNYHAAVASGALSVRARLNPTHISPHSSSQGFWPEMGQMLKEHGAHNYCISLLPETNQLFAYVEIESEERWAAVASTEICKKWWKWMEEYIVFNDDGTPKGTPLKEMFFLP
jgi:L-rhamnose mutarotase